MDKIEVVVLNQAHNNPAGMQLFLAKLTQRGAVIHNADDLMALYKNCVTVLRKPEAIQDLAAMPHGTIKRFAPITIAIVGASRRFLAQARTNQVGLDYVSGSLQYSDYSDKAQFVVPYELMHEETLYHKERYLESCQSAMEMYAAFVKGPTIFGRQLQAVSNDTAGYAAPQGLRNILIMQGNHQSWDYFIRLRSCNRNTVETQYVTMLIWEALLNTFDGKDLFHFAGPDCLHGRCREGKMCCGNVLYDAPASDYYLHNPTCTAPRAVIETKWPLLKGGN